MASRIGGKRWSAAYSKSGNFNYFEIFNSDVCRLSAEPSTLRLLKWGLEVCWIIRMSAISRQCHYDDWVGYPRFTQEARWRITAQKAGIVVWTTSGCRADHAWCGCDRWLLVRRTTCRRLTRFLIEESYPDSSQMIPLEQLALKGLSKENATVAIRAFRSWDGSYWKKRAARIRVGPYEWFLAGMEC